MSRLFSRLIAFLLWVLIAGIVSCTGEQGYRLSADERVKTGARVLLEKHVDELQKRKVGLVMNPTARVGDVHLVDTLMELNVPIKALFAPEHGFRGEKGAGEKISGGTDPQTGLPVYSLYGSRRKPTAGMLKNVNLLIFDMQDVGARFYTYNVTLGNILEAAARHGVEVWVLDRPNPAGGDYVAGWMLNDEYRSFVGKYPIPVIHGLTMGELARMMIGEGWLDTPRSPDLRVIRMRGWERSMRYPATGLKWHPPSPNLPSFKTAFVYLGTCFFEGTSLSEGRGTDTPFLKVGAPDMRVSNDALQKLEQIYPVKLRKTTFTPRSIPGKAGNPKFEGERIHGVRIKVANEELGELDPLTFGLDLLGTLMDATPGSEISQHLYRLAGTKEIKKIIRHHTPENITKSWKSEVRNFRKKRRSYLLYH